MKLNRKQLRSIISEVSQEIDEGCGEPIITEPAMEASMKPCPYSAAKELKNAGMTEAEVLQWVNTMLSAFLNDDHSHNLDDAMLSGDESFVVVTE